MAKIVRSLLFLALLITSSFSHVFSQPCSTHQFPNHKPYFASCNDLPVLMQAPLHANKPSMHPMPNPNLKDFVVSGHPLVSLMKIFHGILNTFSWGILLPIGIIVARNFQYEQFHPAWFYVHVSCQFLGSLGGIVGWVTGHILGSKSAGIEYKCHKCIGVALLILVIFQLLAGAALRPKRDSKYRWMWNLFHHVVGYTIVILGSVNIFKGFGIVEDMGAPKWMRLTYEIILGLEIVVGGLAQHSRTGTITGTLLRRKPMGDEII